MDRRVVERKRGGETKEEKDEGRKQKGKEGRWQRGKEIRKC